MSKRDRDRVKRLPPGPHGIPRELVERNQRERLIAAIAEACAERGYAAVTVADVTRRASVSTASFYRQFKDKRECALAGFEELFGRLLEEVKRACGEEEEPSERVRIGIRTAAGLLGGDLPTARLLTLEIVAVGPEGVQIQQDAIERLATLLREARAAAAVSSTSSPTPEWAAVAAMVALIARGAAEGESTDAAALETLAAWL